MAKIPSIYIETDDDGMPDFVEFDARQLLSMWPLEVALNYGESIETQIADGMGVLFYGLNGIGKTHLACIIGMMAVKRGYHVRFTTVEGMLKELKDWFSRKKEGEALDDPTLRYERCDLLILDELAQSTPSDWSGDRVFELVNNRMNNSLPTIYTTNADPDLLGQRLSPRNKLTAAALTDRILGATYAVHVEAHASWRLVQQEKKFDRLMKGRKNPSQ